MIKLLLLSLGFLAFLAAFSSPGPFIKDQYAYAEIGECEFVAFPDQISPTEQSVVTIKNKTDSKRLEYELVYHEPAGEVVPPFNSSLGRKRLGPKTAGPGEIISFIIGPLKPGPYVFYASRPKADAPDCQSTQVGVVPQTRVTSVTSTPINAPLKPADRPAPCDTAGGEGLETAIGCIPIKDANAFLGFFFRWAVGIAGGIAFLLITVSGFQIMTASNNPQQLQSGRELLTAAVSGLILIIFSVFLLRLIGIEILKIPGLGT